MEFFCERIRQGSLISTLDFYGRALAESQREGGRPARAFLGTWAPMIKFPLRRFLVPFKLPIASVRIEELDKARIGSTSNGTAVRRRVADSLLEVQFLGESR